MVRIRALYFPDDSKQPRWEWVKIEDQVPQYRHLLGDGDTTGDRREISFKKCRQCNINSMIVVFRDNFLKDGSRKNPSLATVTAGSLGHDWRGPIICMGYTRSGTFSIEDYDDFQIGNVRDIVEYVQDYNDDSLDLKAFDVSKPVDGVRILCDDDMRNFGQNKSERVSIPGSHDIFTSGSVSEIADRVNLPLLIYQIEADQQWKNVHFGHIIQDVTFLFTNIDPDKDYSRIAGPLGWG
ncbi:MAG: hypothetical protein L6R37_005109 [Teloschistes peruensis]|nr:MAG: hypothetical protein L6R37_005109 [Teloschistes peruensis]